MFWSINNSGEVLSKLTSRGFRMISLSTYDFSTLYTTFPHNLIYEKLFYLIAHAYKIEGMLYLDALFNKIAFFTSTDHRGHTLWSCQNVCDVLPNLLDNTSDWVISNTDKLLVIGCVQIVLPLWAICFYSAMKEIS